MESINGGSCGQVVLASLKIIVSGQDFSHPLISNYSSVVTRAFLTSLAIRLHDSLMDVAKGIHKKQLEDAQTLANAMVNRYQWIETRDNPEEQGYSLEYLSQTIAQQKPYVQFFLGCGCGWISGYIFRKAIAAAVIVGGIGLAVIVVVQACMYELVVSFLGVATSFNEAADMILQVVMSCLTWLLRASVQKCDKWKGYRVKWRTVQKDVLDAAHEGGRMVRESVSGQTVMEKYKYLTIGFGSGILLSLVPRWII